MTGSPLCLADRRQRLGTRRAHARWRWAAPGTCTCSPARGSLSSTATSITSGTRAALGHRRDVLGDVALVGAHQRHGAVVDHPLRLALARPRRLPWLSPEESLSLRPSRDLIPPAALMSATASLAPSSIRRTDAGEGPLVGWIEPIGDVVRSPRSRPSRRRIHTRSRHPGRGHCDATLASLLHACPAFHRPPPQCSTKRNRPACGLFRWAYCRCRLATRVFASIARTRR